MWKWSSHFNDPTLSQFDYILSYTEEILPKEEEKKNAKENTKFHQFDMYVNKNVISSCFEWNFPEQNGNEKNK